MKLKFTSYFIEYSNLRKKKKIVVGSCTHHARKCLLNCLADYPYPITK